MTELKTDRDLVELLRQRVRRAWEDPAVSRPGHRLQRLIAERLGDLLDALDDPDDPAVLAVARALLGEDSGTTTRTEWSTARDDHDLDGVRLPRLGSRAAAESALRNSCEHQIVRRTVTYGPWQVVATESGEPS